MTYRAIGFLALLVTAFLFGPGAALAENRLALVIGNSEYRTVTVLPNPANDAKAMTKLLKDAQFDVTEVADLSQTDLGRAFRDFAAKVAKAGSDTVALVYYAGHGLQIDGENYLVPVDAEIQREADVPLQAMRLNDAVNILRAVQTKTLIAIFDACRNNPFSAINKTIGRGLAIVDAPKGTIVSYSTSPGGVAKDGAGDNSPFTAALVEIARRPNVPIEQTFKDVRIAVNQTTKGEQTPWESTSLTTNFMFFGEGKGDKDDKDDKDDDAAKHETKTVEVWRTEFRDLEPEAAFELVIGADRVEAYEAFLALFERSRFRAQVRVLFERRQEMRLWYNAVVLNTAAAFEAFLERFPNSDLVATAKRLRDRARNRALALGLANRSLNNNSAANNAAPKVKVVEKVVEVPKIIEKVRVVEKIVKVPEVKIVEKVVKVKYCPPPKRKKPRRRTRRRPRYDDDYDEPRYVRPPPVFVPGITISPNFGRRRRHHD